VNSGAPEGQAVPTPQVVPDVLHIQILVVNEESGTYPWSFVISILNNFKP